MAEAGTMLAGDLGQRREIFAAHIVDKTEKNCLFLLGGNEFYDLTLDTPRDYDDDFSCVAVNVDPKRCKRVVFGKIGQYRLWPLQFVRIIRCRDVWLPDPPAQRWKLPDSRTIFVAPDGDDTVNDGMLATSPLRTAQFAANLAMDQFDINGTHADIKLLDGLYSVPAGGQLINVPRPIHGQNKIRVVGNLDEPDRVVVNIPAHSHGFYVEDFGILTVSGMRIATTGSGSFGLLVRQFGIGDLDWVHFGKFDDCNPVMTSNGSVNLTGPIRLEGNANFMFAAARGGQIDLGSHQIEIAKGLRATRMLHAESGARIYAQQAKWSALGGGVAPVVGAQKAFAHGQGSQIYINPRTMPGTIAHATADGGQLFQISAS